MRRKTERKLIHKTIKLGREFPQHRLNIADSATTLLKLYLSSFFSEASGLNFEQPPTESKTILTLADEKLKPLAQK
jgi:hypothetical protein